MSVPVRVLAPVQQLVSTSDLRAHCRVLHTHEDGLLETYRAAAIAHLDGYRGILGRCIMPQKWAVTFEEAGTFRLPFPDVSEVSAVDADDAAVAATLSHDAIGSIVEIEAAATVTLTAALPADALPAVRLAVLLLVGHWYQNREALAEQGLAELPMAVSALIAPLRAIGV